jgi:IS5 family transposase
LQRQACNGNHPKRAKAAKNAQKRLKTIAGAQLRELERRMTEDKKARYKERLELYKRAVSRQKNDKIRYTACTNRSRVHSKGKSA